MDKEANPFDFFEEIYCICVKGRQQKRNKIEKQFRELGILDRVIFFDAILREPYWDGCRESHKECVRRAKGNNCNNVLIFEEDVFFLHKDLDALSSAIFDLKKETWNIFTLGCTVETVVRNTKKNLCVVKGYLNHAYAVNKNFFDEILNFNGYKNQRYYDDGKFIWSMERLDMFFRDSECKKHMIKPLMAVQPHKSKTLDSYYDKLL